MSGSTTVKCSNCGAKVPASNVNIQEMVAVCPECDHMFRLENTANRLALSTQRKIKPPETFDVIETDREIHISYRMAENLTGLEKISYGITTFGLLMGVAFTLVMISAGEWVLMLLGFAYIGFILYYTLLALLNTRRIVLDEETLSWFDDPLWMPIKRSFITHEINHISIQPSRAAEVYNAKGYYELRVQRYDGTSEIFMDYLPRKSAVYLQHALEAHLFGDYENQTLSDETETRSEGASHTIASVEEENRHRLNGSH